MGADGEPRPTLFAQAHELGKATSLVTTGQVTDASPAAFGAHVRNRNAQSQIARQYLGDSRPDVILGAGKIGGSRPATRARSPTARQRTGRSAAAATRVTSSSARSGWATST